MAALDPPRTARHSWRPAATAVAVIAGAILGISMADIGAAILRSVLLVAALVALVVLTARRIRIR